MTPDATRTMRHPLMLIGLVAASAIVIAGLSVTRASMVESEARAELTAAFNETSADLAGVNDRTVAARTVEGEAQECVDAEARRLAPVLTASARFSTTTVALASASAGRATRVDADAPAFVANVGALTLSPVVPPADASVDELVAALDQAREIRADAGAATQRAELAALERHAACESARRAVAAVISEVGLRTEAVIAANGAASPASIEELRAARDAVLAVEGDATGAEALPRWLSAASAVESSHVVANAEAIAAAERAAAEAGARSTGGSASRPGSGPAPLAHPEWRILTPEEVAALGMPPGSVIQEVPPGTYPSTLPDLD